MTLDDWAKQTYVAVTTFKRDGTPVATPVWIVRDGEELALVTGANSGKVKRIRNNPAVTIAPCTMRGKVLGPSTTGRASLLPLTETNRIRALLRKKYGILGWLVMSDKSSDGSLAVGIALTSN